jgi:hypothetical protein
VINLQQLNDLGGFIPDELVKKEIKFKLDEEGEEHVAEIFVRRLSIGVHEAIWRNATEDMSQTAKMLAEAIRLGENGEEKLTYEDAYRLHPKIALAMSQAIGEVNGGERKN